ncbi:MAG TPA: ABC transporter ATP-binding protein [Stellaceae bacterium]|nr:ABC transporter ATP-binding protein [Stellaceae bacterium]
MPPLVDPPYLALRGLAKSYGEGKPAVAGIDLDAARGEFLTLLGPSGCGKTTVLRMIAGLVPPSAGRLAVDGVDITALPAHQRNMGLVFQSYALFPHLSVARNVAFGLEMRGAGKAAIERRVADSLALVRLAGLRQRMPRELSGGQQQRVALARALVIEPSLLLLDEPLSNLDAKLREELRDEIRDIQRRLGITAVFVTHDQVEALTLSDRVAVMNEGRLEQIGTPTEIYEEPASAFVAAFIGRTNRIEARVAAGDATSSLLATGALRFSAIAALPVGTVVTAMIRPHRIRLGDDRMTPDEATNRIRARVRKIVFAGDVVQCEIAAEGITLLVESPTASAGSAPAVGDEVTASWRPADTLVFATP